MNSFQREEYGVAYVFFSIINMFLKSLFHPGLVAPRSLRRGKSCIFDLVENLISYIYVYVYAHIRYHMCLYFYFRPD